MANTFPSFPSDLRFGSYLAYPNRRATEQAADPSSANACRNLILAVKRDAVSPKPKEAPRTLIQMWIRQLAATLGDTPLTALLDRSATLIPMPRSSPLLPRSVWPALRVAEAMVDQGLGAEVMPCLKRANAVAKSAFAGPRERPTPFDHYRSLAVELIPGIPDRVILIDDVVTRGSMFSGAYARLNEVLEGAEIVAAFAFARTVQTFTGTVDACVGRIACDPAGSRCTRTP